jgi:hypothetical protein
MDARGHPLVPFDFAQMLWVFQPRGMSEFGEYSEGHPKLVKD